jgi:hypothetical protein
MNTGKLERAIALGRKVEHSFIAMVDGKGVPYVNSVRQIEQVADNQFAVEEWICPMTVTNLGENPKLALVIWDPATDEGYEIIGEVLMFEGQAFLNGFAPEVEENAYLPQVRRRLIIRAEQIAAFSHALRCAAIQPINVEHRVQASLRAGNGGNGGEVSVCGFAPEWAEHARFDRDDAPCDDGRAGMIHDR